MLSYSTHAELVVSKVCPKLTAGTAVLMVGVPVADGARVNGDLAGLPAEVRAGVELVAEQVSKGKLAAVSTSVVKWQKGVVTVGVIGTGPVEKVTTEELRKVGAAAYRTARRAKLAAVTLIVPAFETVTPTEVGEALATGAILASFEYGEYVGSRRRKEVDGRQPVKVVLVSDHREVAGGVERGEVVALSTNFARTVASRPGNDINPVTLATLAKELAKEVGLGVRVVDEKEMKKLGMGGLLGVGGGSETPPRLVALEYKPARAKKGAKGPLLVVGKSITFDTGGISIKPAEKMQRMIYDKCGGMAVLGLMHAIAKLKGGVHVVGVLTSAENHVSAKSYRPGDILTLYNGVTVEITNTDAEGRLVLADAIAWGIETYKPRAVVDLATLTGGVVVALGTTMAGMFSNNDALAAEIDAAGKASGEKMWRLPVGDDQREMLKSDLADVVNSAGRHASPLTGAAFVSLAVPADGSVPWVHLDIAGVADTEKELGYVGKGATGYGVRTLVRWVMSQSTQS